MKRIIVYVIAVLACLALAQLDLVLYYSFSSDFGSQWVLQFFSPAVPADCAWWLISAGTIGLVLALAITFRHRWSINPWLALFATTLIGIVIIPVLRGTIDSLWAMKPWADTVRNFLEPDAVAATAFISLIAACLGVAFGRHLATAPPAGPMPFRLLVRRMIASIRKLWASDSQAMLKVSQR